MVSKRLSIYGFISVAAVVSGVLAGCGGGSSSVAGQSGTVTTSGGAATTTQTFTSGVGSTTAPQQVQVTINGSTVSASLPANTTIPAGSTVAIVPTTPIIPGLTLGPKAQGEKAAPTTTKAYEIYDNGNDSGVSVGADGALSTPLILIPGKHTLTVSGPFNIVGGTGLNPTQLTVKSFIFKEVVNSDGTSSIPVFNNFKLPSNGQSIAHGCYVTSYFDPSFIGHTGSLTIQYGSTTIAKNVTIAAATTGDYSGDGYATYNALSSHPKIPTGGVNTVEFDVN